MYTNPNIRYDGQNILIKKDVLRGFDEHVCVHCQVDKNTSLTFPWHIVQYNKPTEDDPDVTAKINSISSTGKVKVEFNQDMNTDFDLNMLSSSYFPYKSTNATKSGRVLAEDEEAKSSENYIQIYVAPHDDWDKGTTATAFRSWKATSFVKNQLEISIDF